MRKLKLKRVFVSGDISFYQFDQVDRHVPVAPLIQTGMKMSSPAWSKPHLTARLLLNPIQPKALLHQESLITGKVADTCRTNMQCHSALSHRGYHTPALTKCQLILTHTHTTPGLSPPQIITSPHEQCHLK